MNLTHHDAEPTHEGILQLTDLKPDVLITETRKIVMPDHHDVRPTDVNMKRLAAVVTLARETEILDFESLLLVKGLGPRTLQSLTLVSEVIHGTPSRFDDPARFSFAHGGKDGHPFPVPLKVYDETISVLNKAIERSKLDLSDKRDSIKRLSKLAQKIENDFEPNPGAFEKLMEDEHRNSKQYGGRTVFDDVGKRKNQLDLFDDLNR